jgi:AcrR family transcriptional regulator
MPGSPPADEEPERFEPDDLAALPPELALSRLPVGRHGLPRSFVSSNQRLRLVAAMLRVLQRHGYPATTIGHVTREAGVSRATFYKQFEDKQECFLATYDLAAAWLCDQVECSVAAHREWPERVRVGVAAALRLLAANPGVANLIAIEALQAGQAARRRRQACVGRLAETLRDGRPMRAELPLELDEMLLGGVFSHVALYVETGRTEQLPDSTAELVQYLLIPFLEPGETRRIAEQAA